MKNIPLSDPLSWAEHYVQRVFGQAPIIMEEQIQQIYEATQNLISEIKLGERSFTQLLGEMSKYISIISDFYETLISEGSSSVTTESSEIPEDALLTSAQTPTNDWPSWIPDWRLSQATVPFFKHLGNAPN